MCPLYDYLDEKCGRKFEAYAGLNDEKLPCRTPGCDGTAERIFVSVSGIGERWAQNFEPPVIFRWPDGTPWFPGRSDEPVPEGLRREELRTTADVRKFEAEMNKREYAQWQEHQENVDRAREENISRRREDIHALMRGEGRQVTTYDEKGRERTVTLHGFSPLGRELAHIAMENANNRPRPKFNPNFHVQIFSQDSSNRREWRDIDTNWQGRKY
jgi:hypothetical protein